MWGEKNLTLIATLASSKYGSNKTLPTFFLSCKRLNASDILFEKKKFSIFF